MKPFEDLTDEELVALTDEEQNTYVDLACAEAGVALLPDPPQPPAPIEMKPTLTYYTVAGTNLEFLEKQDALNVRDAIAAAKSLVDVRYVGNNYHAKKIIKADRAIHQAVNEDLAFDENAAERNAAALASYHEAKAHYDRERAEYDNVTRKRSDISAPIQNTIREARQREDRRRLIRRQHERYLSLAGGLRRVAARFLENAYSDAKELCPDLFEFSVKDPVDPRAPRAYMEPETDADLQNA